MQIAAVPISDAVRVRLVNRGKGWQLWHWYRRDLMPITIQPEPADRTRRFASPQEAAAYFRRRYPELGPDALIATLQRWNRTLRQKEREGAPPHGGRPPHG